MAPGATAKLTVWRKGEEKTFSIALGELPNQREAKAGTPDSSGRNQTLGGKSRRGKWPRAPIHGRGAFRRQV
jgi:serine protease Do